MRVSPPLHFLQLSFVLSLLIRPTPLRFQHLNPSRIFMRRLLALVELPRKHLHLLREISPEVRRVDDDVVDLALRTELDNRPVNVLSARALRFPAVAHVLAAAREEEIVLCAEVLVGARYGDAAHDGGAELEDGVRRGREHGHCDAVQAEPRDASIRVHEQTDVRVRLVCDLLQQPAMPLTGAALLLRQYRLPPLEVLALDLLLVCLIRNKAALDRDLRRVIPVEEGSIDFHAGDAPAGYA